MIALEPIDALERIAFAAVAVTTSALDDVGGHELTFLAWRALVVLGAAGVPIRASELGARLGASKPSTSKLIRRLERRRLVALASDPGDGRVVLVRLSEDGARLRAAVIARRRELLADALGAELRPGLAEGLAAIAERLEPWI